MTAAVLEGGALTEEPTREPSLQTPLIAVQDDPHLQQGEVTVTEGGVHGFFRWFKETLCCRFLPEDADFSSV